MTRSGDLYELQSIDTLLDQNRIRLKEIAAKLADDSKMKSAESNFISAERNMKKASIKLKESEKKVKEQRLKIKTTDAKLYGGKITNPKELKDLQDESESLKRYLSILEDRQLEKMLDLDEIIEQHKNEEKKLDTTKEAVKLMHQEFTMERERIEINVKTLESRRQSTTAIIPKEDLVLYEKLRKIGHGLAVAKVNNRSCSACGATLTAALHQSARSPNNITLCETCGRILYA